MDDDEYEDSVMRRAVEVNGSAIQVLKCCEELSELLSALVQTLDGGKEVEAMNALDHAARESVNMVKLFKETLPDADIYMKPFNMRKMDVVIGELVDVGIVTDTLARYVFDCDELYTAMRKYKINRLESFLDTVECDKCVYDNVRELEQD